MPAQKFKNIWGAAGSNTDQQRSDLFVVSLKIPPALQIAGAPGTTALWDTEIGFAVSQYPFVARSQEMQPVKYLQQTNFQLGADAPSAVTTMHVRYAFNRRMGEILERWKWLMSNPRTGGTAITSAVKTTGTFYWLVPDMDAVSNVDDIGADVMFRGPAYHLEGVLVEDLKPSDANMEQNGLVSFDFGLRIDRYYPLDTGDLVAANLLTDLGISV